MKQNNETKRKNYNRLDLWKGAIQIISKNNPSIVGNITPITYSILGSSLIYSYIFKNSYVFPAVIIGLGIFYFICPIFFPWLFQDNTTAVQTMNMMYGNKSNEIDLSSDEKPLLLTEQPEKKSRIKRKLLVASKQ